MDPDGAGLSCPGSSVVAESLPESVDRSTDFSRESSNP